MAVTATGKNQIMIFGPKTDGTYVVEFRTAAGEALAQKRSQGQMPLEETLSSPALPIASALELSLGADIP
jgi:hypothetical protein